MSLQSLVSSPRIMRLSMFFSRRTPERLGHRAAWWAAGVVCRFEPAVYRIVQANLSQVLGLDMGRAELGHAVRRVLYTAIRGYYDLFRALGLPWEAMSDLVDVPQEARAVARSLWNREGGAVIVSTHLGNFDLGGHAMVSLLPEAQLITLADPPPGFQLLNESRRRSGVEITPLSSAALRQAI
jgi:lauroyl/myristoyl acyltransferase